MVCCSIHVYNLVSLMAVFTISAIFFYLFAHALRVRGIPYSSIAFVLASCFTDRRHQCKRNPALMPDCKSVQTLKADDASRSVSQLLCEAKSEKQGVNANRSDRAKDCKTPERGFGGNRERVPPRDTSLMFLTFCCLFVFVMLFLFALIVSGAIYVTDAL